MCTGLWSPVSAASAAIISDEIRIDVDAVWPTAKSANRIAFPTRMGLVCASRIVPLRKAMTLKTSCAATLRGSNSGRSSCRTGRLNHSSKFDRLLTTGLGISPVAQRSSLERKARVTSAGRCCPYLRVPARLAPASPEATSGKTAVPHLRGYATCIFVRSLGDFPTQMRAAMVHRFAVDEAHHIPRRNQPSDVCVPYGAPLSGVVARTRLAGDARCRRDFARRSFPDGNFTKENAT